MENSALNKVHNVEIGTDDFFILAETDNSGNRYACVFLECPQHVELTVHGVCSLRYKLSRWLLSQHVFASLSVFNLIRWVTLAKAKLLQHKWCGEVIRKTGAEVSLEGSKVDFVSDLAEICFGVVSGHDRYKLYAALLLIEKAMEKICK